MLTRWISTITAASKVATTSRDFDEAILVSETALTSSNRVPIGESQPQIQHQQNQQQQQQTVQPHSQPQQQQLPQLQRQQQQQLLTSAQEQWRQLLSGQRSAVHQTQESRQTVLTTTNTRTNFPWGDPLGPKDSIITRLYAINVNGISIDRRGGTFDDICRSVKEMQVDIFCAQEHNLDTTQLTVRSALYETAGKHWTRNRLVMGTSPITFDHAYKPGGTLILTVDSLTGRVVKQDRDKWGRWVIQEFMGRGNRRLVVFSVYQPVDKSSQPGRVTVAAQQVSLLCLSHDSVKNPRRAFCRDLFKALKAYSDDGASLLVLGDFNEKLGTDPDGITQVAGELGLTDLMRSRHSANLPATYARGSKCLDYALASPDVCTSLKAAGYEEFNARIASDHRGYFFDFDTNLLFGSDTQTLVTMEKRGLSASNACQVTEYIRQKHRILSEHNVFERVQTLLHQGNRHEQAERIDKDVLEASLEAETKVTRFGNPAWSVELAQARRIVSILTKQLSALKTGYDHSVILKTAIEALETPFQLPISIQECSTELRKAKVTVRDIVSASYQTRDEERRRKIETLEASQANADRKTALRLRRLKKAEDIKQLFRKLKMVRTKNNRRGVTRIEIPLHPPRTIQKRAPSGLKSKYRPRSLDCCKKGIDITSAKRKVHHSPYLLCRLN
jgi:exonuclease III